MLPKQLKETTMDRSVRTLLQVRIAADEVALTANVVDQLMGNKPEARFTFIQERAEFAKPDELDI
jgi:topoisomerase-4 subunit B